jgi:hypothetical protein
MLDEDNLAREVERNTKHLRKARFEGREIDVRDFRGRKLWYVPPDLVAKVGNMAVFVEE